MFFGVVEFVVGVVVVDEFVVFGDLDCVYRVVVG